MTTNNTTISPELEKQIGEEAALYWEYTASPSVVSAYIAGATAYAPYKERYEQEKVQWANQLMAARNEKEGWQIRYEQAEKLLGKFISRHEAGLLPDMFFYNEIKSFLTLNKD